MSSKRHADDETRPMVTALGTYEPPKITFRQGLDRVAADCTPAPPGKGSPVQGCSIGSS